MKKTKSTDRSITNIYDYMHSTTQSYHEPNKPSISFNFDRSDFVFSYPFPFVVLQLNCYKFFGNFKIYKVQHIWFW